MGGHGGLNILPQKRWNVYNFDNREKVRKDEESAAREEQIKREQSRKRDSELRLEQLRRARGLDAVAPPEPPASVAAEVPEPEAEAEPEQKSDSKHINLFDGIKIFDPIMVGEKRKGREERENERKKKVKKEEVRVVGPEDEKYRLGYGIAGKGVKAPWYAVKREFAAEEEAEERVRKVVEKRKKTVEELREERIKREKAEKEREQALLRKAGGGDMRYRREKDRRQWY